VGSTGALKLGCAGGGGGARKGGKKKRYGDETTSTRLLGYKNDQCTTAIQKSGALKICENGRKA